MNIVKKISAVHLSLPLTMIVVRWLPLVIRDPLILNIAVQL